MAEGPDGERIRSDQALMERIADGDQAAFTSLVAEATPRLLRFARAMLSESPAESEEIVQEALFRLWRSADEWRPEGKISTWLHQVVYRLAIDSIRRRRPSVGVEVIEDDLADTLPTPDQRLIHREDAQTVLSAIGRLAERQRTALVLCHFQDMSQAEAAAVMGVGESAYESLLARARRRLKALLIEGGEGRKQK